jgi:hypothetical protein
MTVDSVAGRVDAAARTFDVRLSRRSKTLLAQDLQSGEVISGLTPIFSEGDEPSNAGVAAATNSRLVAVRDRGSLCTSYPYPELADVGVWRDAVRPEFSWVAPLRELEPPVGEFRVRTRDTQQLLSRLQASAQANAQATSPTGLAVHLPRAVLLVSPDTRLPEKAKFAVTIVGTGVRIKSGRTTKFLPRSAISEISVEGVDQVQGRPRIAAVVAFGVLGLASRKRERSSYMILDSEDGQFVFELQDRLPIELRASLGPLNYQTSTPKDAPAAADPIDEIRRLGGLKDEGLITAEEFEVVKADLLGRLRDGHR